MTGPEHYRAAERLLGECGSAEDLPHLLAAAQVHATLALAAATAQQLADRYVGDGDHITEWNRATKGHDLR